MQAKVINEGPERTIALIFDAGDEVIGNMERFAAEHALRASRFSAIGHSSASSLVILTGRAKSTRIFRSTNS